MQGLRPCQQAQFLEHKNITTYLSCPEKVTFFDSLSRDSKIPGQQKKNIFSFLPLEAYFHVPLYHSFHLIQ
jgi:hypothetical protein